jgi:tetratricopeptide (TPR) repeat protein
MFGAKQPNNYQALMNLPSKKLYDIGHYYAYTHDVSDSALLYLSVLTSRYDKSLDKADKVLYIKGFISKGYVYFFSYYDYSKAYDSFVKAEEISDNIGVKLPELYQNYAYLFATIGEQTKDKKTCLKAINYFKKAFYISLKEKNHAILNTSFGNMLSVANENDALESVKHEWTIYDKVNNLDKPEYTIFNKLLYKYYGFMRSKKYDDAIVMCNKQLSVMTLDNAHIRYICVALLNKAEAYATRGDYGMAINDMLKVEDLGHKYDIKDVLVATFENMAKYYDHLHKSTFS